MTLPNSRQALTSLSPFPHRLTCGSRSGDLPKAKENLNKAIEIFTECGADGWVDKYEKELATIS